MGRILAIYPQEGLLEVIRRVLTGRHTVSLLNNYQTAVEHLASNGAYEAVICGLDAPDRAIEIFSRACDLPANTRLIPIARTREQVGEFELKWNAATGGQERADRLDRQWLQDPCTAGQVLSLFAPPSGQFQPLARNAASEQPPPEVRAGHEIDGYRLIGSIGKGGFGTNWLGRNLTTGKLVAVKCVEGEEQLNQELAALRKYVHVADKSAHLLGVEHINRAGPRLWMVTALADSLTGGYTPDAYKPMSLAAYLETRGHLPETAACEIAVGLLQALSVLHQAGLLHGDVSPANILCLKGRWILADPGLVRFIGETGICRNRVYYPQPAATHASDDLYAVGTVIWDMSSGLWEMVSGQERLRLDGQMLRFLSRQQHPLGKFLCRAAAENPEQRFQVADEMLAELNAAAAKLTAAVPPEKSLYQLLHTVRTGLPSRQGP